MTDSTTSIEKLIEMIAVQNNLITALTERMTRLEQNVSADGVYFDGVPEYAKMYLQETEKKKEV